MLEETGQAEVLNESEETGVPQTIEGATSGDESEQKEESTEVEGQGQSKSYNAKQRLRRKLNETEAEKARLAEVNRRLEEKLTSLETKVDAVLNPPPKRPSRVDFDTEEEYEDSLLDWKIGKQTAPPAVKPVTEPVVQPKVKVTDNWLDSVDEATEKYPDFNDVVFKNLDLPISDSMIDVMMELDNGAEVAYFLGKNPAEAAKIHKMGLVQQVKEIEKLSKKFITTTTSAPEPVTPIKGAEVPAKDPEKMTPEEYYAYRRKQGMVY